MVYKNGRRRNSRKDRKFMNEMNMTPLIDVMTVLLTVFMVTAPLLTSGIDLDLPNGGSSTINKNAKAINISIDQDGKLYLANKTISRKNLMIKLSAILKKNNKSSIVISADQGVSYGNVIEVMGMIKDMGFKEVALKTTDK